MPHVHINAIIIAPNRQRQEFNPESLAELSQSIQKLGLLHPIVCRNTPDGAMLVAGERRLRAMQMLIELDIPFNHGSQIFSEGLVPVTWVDMLSTEEAFEAELEENIMRVDLTWQERATAVQQLHSLRTKQKASIGEVQTLSATVNEIKRGDANNWDMAVAREELIVASHMDDPEVAKASSVKEALKVVEKKKKKAHREELAKTFDLAKTPHTVKLGDSEKLFETLEDESVDCLLTDPPYGMDAADFGSNFHTSHEYNDTWDYFTKLGYWLARQSFRVLKPNTHAYVFCNFSGFAYLQTQFESAGFKVWAQPMIWSKGNGNAPWITKGHKKTYECILFASKGAREMNIVKTDVLSYPPVTERDHAAEKPVALYVDLLSRSVNPGDTVLDPFAGSGTIFAAADECSCIGIGFERSQDYYNGILNRIKQGPAYEDALL
jgi:site-specific DNA-methyltransferase (adenine-specific)